MWGEPSGQGWTQVLELAAALVLCSVIGLERTLRRKSAGMRTHAIVGMGAALFVLVSKYGFTDVLDPGRVVLDPSRVAAQVVTGIGFVGAGIIFVRRDAVRGLTTAAAVWISASVGMACGAGLPVLAGFVTAAYFVIVYAYPPLIRRLQSGTMREESITVRYADGHGLLRSILATATGHGFAVTHVRTDRDEDDHSLVVLVLTLRGRGDLRVLIPRLSEIDGVRETRAGFALDDDEAD